MSSNNHDNSKKGKEIHPMVSVPEAIKICINETKKILQSNKTLTQEEEISLTGNISELLGRIVSKDVTVSEPGYPSFRSSIMDGYAIFLSDGDEDGKYEVVGTSYAGEEYIGKNSRNSAIASYVTTGAAIPKEFNTVIPIEQCTVTTKDDKQILTINKDVINNMQVGQWIRQIGSDIPANQIILKRNERIKDIAQLAICLQCGITTINVCTKIRIGILSSGNELLSNSKDGIVDVNRPILKTILHQIDPAIDVIDIGIVPDSPTIIEQTLTKQLNNNLNLIISTGGVSMGEKDYFESILDKLQCNLVVGRLHMKPGKPTKVFNYKNECLVLGLPGNPVSAFVCAHLLVYPIFNVLRHNETVLHPEIQAVYKGPTIHLDKERPEYHRVSLSYNYNNSITSIIASSTGKQRSSMVMSLIHADGVMCLPQGNQENSSIFDGEQVLVLLFNRNFNNNIFPPVKLDESRHVNTVKKKEIYGVNILYIGTTANNKNIINNVKERVQTSLGKYYTIHDISSIAIPSTFSNLHDETTNLKGKIVNTLQSEKVKINIILIENINYQISLLLCNLLSNDVLVPCKEANALALQMRRGGGSKNASAALFETFVCWFEDTLCMVLPYDEKGASLECGLDSVSGKLLGHVIKLGSGGKSCGGSHGH